MNRRTQFLTAAVAALLTFGTLTLTLGERYNQRWNNDGFRYHRGYGNHHDNCDGRVHAADSINNKNQNNQY